MNAHAPCLLVLGYSSNGALRIIHESISALHKAVRGSDPDAALSWFVRMLDGGVDPRYATRRLVRMASQDIGLSEPRALRLALDAAETYERLGSPEGELALAQAVSILPSRRRAMPSKRPATRCAPSSSRTARAPCRCACAMRRLH